MCALSDFFTLACKKKSSFNIFDLGILYYAKIVKSTHLCKHNKPLLGGFSDQDTYLLIRFTYGYRLTMLSLHLLNSVINTF